MSEETKEIAESLREISTPTGLSYSGDRTLNNSYTEKIIDYITSLQQRVEQLENIRKEAIEYIKNCEIVDKDKRYLLLEEQFGEDLFNILNKGSDLS